MGHEPGRLLAALAISAATLLFATDAPGQAFTVLHAFAGNAHGDGANPAASLLIDQRGNLYGTTQYGPARVKHGGFCRHGCGTAFELDSKGDETVLHAFEGNKFDDGAEPVAALIADAEGNLYGTTQFGGAGTGQLLAGTVFQISPDGTEKLLHVFSGEGDGHNPEAGLVMDAAGNLYGTTSSGGTYAGDCGPDGCGTVFKLAPDGTETILHEFTGGADGVNPMSPLVLDAAGNLYGTTYGAMYGMTYEEHAARAGTVFRISPTGRQTILYTFTGAKDGGYPSGGLFMNQSGDLFGTTSSGGRTSGGCPTAGCGVVFEVDPNGGETVLYAFKGNRSKDGLAPSATLISDSGGNLYGTTTAGGGTECDYDYNTPGCGTIFEVTAGGIETVLYAFQGGGDGGDPRAGLIQDAAGDLYGTAYEGGEEGDGVVFKFAARQRRHNSAKGGSVQPGRADPK